MLARVIGIKAVLVLVSVVLGAATAFATSTSDPAQSEATLHASSDVGGADAGDLTHHRQPIQAERSGGKETGEATEATEAAENPAPASDSPDHTQSSNATGGGADDGATGPDPTAQARFGLCRAFAEAADAVEASNKDGSVAYQNLADAAAAAGQSVADFCEDVTPPGRGEEQRTSGGPEGHRPSDSPSAGTAPGADQSDSHQPDSPPGSPEGTRSSRL